MKRLILLLILAALLAPAPCLAASARAVGPCNNDPNLIVDGKFPPQGTAWTDPACVWWNGTATALVVDLGRVERITAVTLQVDNNDDYAVEYSEDGKSFKTLFLIRASYGEVGWGMDTMSTDPGSPDYVPEIKFTPVNARFIGIKAIDGDNCYAVSELAVSAKDAAGHDGQAGPTVTGYGSYNNDASLIADGVTPAQGTAWNDSACVWWHGTQPYFVMDLGTVTRVSKVTLQVDNNDEYVVEYSQDGKIYRNLFTVRPSFGQVGWGMDTMSTDPSSPDYVHQIEFPPVMARFIKIRAAGGDDCYAVSELTVGDPAYVPPANAGGGMSVSGYGPFHNDAALIIDGAVPAQGTSWTDAACVWWNGTKTFFVVDLGMSRRVGNVRLQVDNNDDYVVEYSEDGKTYRNLFTVRASYGEVGWGMDTMSTDPGSPDYVPELRFAPVTARYLKIRAIGGDDCYAVSELSVSD